MSAYPKLMVLLNTEMYSRLAIKILETMLNTGKLINKALNLYFRDFLCFHIALGPINFCVCIVEAMVIVKIHCPANCHEMWLS